MEDPRLMLRGIVRTAAYNYGFQAMTLLNAVVVARVLTPEGRGVLAVVQWLPPLLVLVAAFGMTQALVYYGTKERERLGTYTVQATLLGLVLAGVLCVGCLPLLPLLIGEQEAWVYGLAMVFLLAVPLEIAGGFPREAQLCVPDFVRYNRLRLMFPVLYGVAIGVLYLADALRMGPLVVALLLCYAVQAVAGWVSLRGALRGVGLTVRREGIEVLIRYGFPCLLASLPAILTVRLGQWVLVRQGDLGAVGLFVVAATWGFMAAPVWTAIQTHLFPRLAESVAGKAQQLEVVAALRYGVLLLVVLLVGGWFVTPLLFPLLFGEAYASASATAAMALVWGGFSGMNTMTGFLARGMGQPRIALAGELLVLLVVVLAVLFSGEDWTPFSLMAWISVAAFLGAVLSCLWTLRAAGVPLSALVRGPGPHATSTPQGKV